MGDIIQGIGSYLGGKEAASAARDAANLAQARYLQTRSDLQPYNVAGQNVLPELTSVATSGPTGGGPDYVAMAQGALPGTMTQAELEQTPGYQFQRAQGLKAVQSAAAAKGLGVSGASLKGAATFATGLADANYQQQFNNQQQKFVDINSLNTAQQGNVTNEYNRLSGLSTLGANAGAAVGTQGTALANQAGNALTNAGVAQAQGLKGLTTGIGNTLNDLGGYYMTGGSSNYA
jgi:hypothetical protein